MQIYSQKDVDKKALKGARIAVLGYGSQAAPMHSTEG
jgi:ketol-acid reductoisomerase